MNEPVALARAAHEEAREGPELPHRLEEVHLADGVCPQRLRRRLPRRRHEALGCQMNDAVGPRLLEERAHGEQITQVGLDQVDPLAQGLDVLGLAPPTKRADHVGAALESELGEVAAHEACDAGDQETHRTYPTIASTLAINRATGQDRGAIAAGASPRRIARRSDRRSGTGSASAQSGLTRKIAHQGA